MPCGNETKPPCNDAIARVMVFKGEAGDPEGGSPRVLATFA